MCLVGVRRRDSLLRRAASASGCFGECVVDSYGGSWEQKSFARFFLVLFSPGGAFGLMMRSCTYLLHMELYMAQRCSNESGDSRCQFRPCLALLCFCFASLGLGPCWSGGWGHSCTWDEVVGGTRGGYETCHILTGFCLSFMYCTWALVGVGVKAAF